MSPSLVDDDTFVLLPSYYADGEIRLTRSDGCPAWEITPHLDGPHVAYS
jgi:hypothetical protein